MSCSCPHEPEDHNQGEGREGCQVVVSMRPGRERCGCPGDDPVVLHFDRLEDGTLAALHSHDGRSIGAIVYPPIMPGRWRRWVLAGDLDDRSARPGGASDSVTLCCANAAQALGVELGIAVLGYEVNT